MLTWRTTSPGGLDLHYKAAVNESVQVVVAATDGMSMTETTIVSNGTVSAGELDEAAAQHWRGRCHPHRPDLDSGRLPLCHHQSDHSGSGGLNPSVWNVCLVYEGAVEVTLNFQLTGTAGDQNTIDSVPVTDLWDSSNQGNVIDQVPQGGFRQVYFDITSSGIDPDPGPSNPDKDEDGDGNIEDSDGDGVITVGNVTITMAPTSGEDTGQPHNPTVTVVADGQTLMAGTDYTVTYWDEQAGVQTTMVDPGSYTVRVTILGSYAGTYDLTYTITAASGPVTPPGGGTVSPPGGDPGSDPSDPGEEDPGEDNPGEDTPGLADPDETGVSDWLITDAHIAYLQGYGDLFVPGANMTRAEVAQMFYNLLRDKDVPITVTFSDVSAGQWYAEAVQTLASLGMIQGYGNGIFEPNAPITRAEFIAIAMRFTNGSAQGEDIFTDVSANDWFYEAVLGAVAYGWVEGYGDGTFHPEASITRAEVTAIANRMLGRVADRNYIDSQELTVRFTDNDPSNWAYYDIVEATNAHSFTHTDGQESWTGLTGSDS